MDGVQFEAFLKDINLSIDSKEARALVFYFKALGLEIEKKNFIEGLSKLKFF